MVVALAVEGARASLRGDEVVLDTGARRLSYGKLVAFDARERRLPAEFAIEGGRVRIELDDAGAEYPVVIDPLIAGTWDAVLESDRAGSGLGLSVAGAGDVNGDGYDDVIVGAWTYDNGVSNEVRRSSSSVRRLGSRRPSPVWLTHRSNPIKQMRSSGVVSGEREM
ncbi:MAG: integrin alpha [Myxococcota bacterium]